MKKRYEYIKNLTGSSKNDRISLYSYNNGATAIRKENGQITIEYGKDESSLKTSKLFLLIFFWFISILKILIIIPLIKNGILNIISYLIPTFFYLCLMIICIIAIRNSGKEEFLKNHAAEHMCIAAYKKYGRVPTLEEIKKFSRISKRCGVTIFSAYITSQLIGFIVYSSINFLIPEFILFFLPLFLHSTFPFNLIGKVAQLFTTKKPEIHNLELALAAMTALEKEEFLNN